MRSRVQLVLGMALVVALVATGVVVWLDRITPVNIAITTPATQSIHVSVSGAVASPGVVEIPTGARLQHAVDAAGGFLPRADLTMLNLAGRLGDGEQIHIPATGESPVQASSDGPEAGQTPLNLNTATLEELNALPGIGDVLATRIVEYRNANGPFTSVDQLAEVEGISPRLVDELRPYVTVEPGG